MTETRNRESTKVNEENKQKIIANGGKVRTLTKAQRAAWVKALKPVWKKFEKDVGADTIKAAVAAN